jgi:hypothetical protein
LRQQSFILTGTLASKLSSIVCYADAVCELGSPVDQAMLKKLVRDREVADWLGTLGPHIRVRHRSRVKAK